MKSPSSRARCGSLWTDPTLWSSSVVVIAPCARIANGLRPENDRLKPHLLKDCESLGLHVFGKELSTTPTGTTYHARHR